MDLGRRLLCCCYRRRTLLRFLTLAGVDLLVAVREAGFAASLSSSTVWLFPASSFWFPSIASSLVVLLPRVAVPGIETSCS